jgi:glyoxylase-like metal-dependent hydrolase (beta-lactamase superfamily II)
MDSVYKVTKDETGFYIIDEGMVRMFLFDSEGEALIIDTGFGGGDLGGLVKELTGKSAYAVLTHSDGDHTNGLKHFGRAYMHPAEFAPFKDSFTESGAEILPVWEGHVFKAGSFNLEVILIPGHTPGSIALVDRDKRILFPGDSIQQGPAFMFGGNRSLQALIASIEKLQAMGLSGYTLYPSHNTCPITEDIFPDVIEGAKRILDGSLTGVEANMGFGDAKVYDYNGVKFLA